jgi:hypothetical protein
MCNHRKLFIRHTVRLISFQYPDVTTHPYMLPASVHLFIFMYYLHSVELFDSKILFLMAK